MKSIKTSLVIFLFLGIVAAKAQNTDLLDYSRLMDEKYQIEQVKTNKLADSLGIIKRVDNGKTLIQLSHFVNGFPRFLTTCNINAAATTSTSAVWPGGVAGLGLTGSGITMGIWDGGQAMANHQEFGSRVTINDGATSTHPHSTHVAGTMIASGIVAAAKGMAYQASLKSYDWNNDVSEMAAAAAVGMQVSNHSYGLITGWFYNYFSDGRWVWFGDTNLSQTTDYGFGAYEQNSYDWDNLSYLAPEYLIVKASGNDRYGGPASQPVEHWVWGGSGYVLSSTVRNLNGSTGYDCIALYGVAKNILAIGSINDILAGYNSPSDVVLAGSSSTGPTDDGRIKPDLVANGVSLYSAYNTSTTSYGSMSGTSMATPNVSGSIGLLLQHQTNLSANIHIKSATIKGILIHTADEAGTNAGPDYKYGWGLLNTKNAAALMALNSTNGSNFNIRELSINQGDTIRIPIYTNGLQPLTATMVWTDRPSSTYTAYLNDTTHMLVNNLDVRLVSNTSQLYCPWRLKVTDPTAAATKGDNNVDNVEKVEAGTPTAQQTWYVQITHKGTLIGGSQDFSLILSGISNPPATSNWNGTISKDWYNPSNWSNGVPGSTTNVVILSGKTNYPTITSRASCNNITMETCATLLDNSLLTVNGTATVNCFISKYASGTDNMYHFLSSPVSSQAISPQFSNPTANTTDDFYKFDEGTYTWINSRSTGNVYNPSFESNFVVGHGYLAAYFADATKYFTGALNTGNKTLSINRTTTDATTSGWNLVGNPYPSNIDWDAASGWTKTNVSNAIYVAKAGGWATYVDGVAVNGGSRYIAVGQGFFVNVTNVGPGSLALTNNVRVHNAATFLKNTKTANLVRIEVSGNGSTDEAVVRFVPETTTGFDSRFDALKLFNFNESSTQIYTNGSLPLAINSLNVETNKVDLGVRANAGGKYALTLTESNGLDFISLHDTKTGIYTNLKAKPYIYFFEPGENETRFELLFKPISEIVTENPVAVVYSYGKTIGIGIRESEIGDIYVYTFAGQLVDARYKVSGTTELGIAVAGIYLVKVMTDKDSVVTKVWVY